jgi:hypothetical protein
MMSSGKPRPENAELERRVKRRPHRLQRKRWPPSWVVPSVVTTSELQRGQGIDASSSDQTTPSHAAAREPAIPLVVAAAVWEIALTPPVDRLWASIILVFAEPPGYGFGAVFQSQTILARLVGAWWFFGLFLVLALFNSILGEEFLFRGLLLPEWRGYLAA